jgi:hypothetical protein
MQAEWLLDDNSCAPLYAVDRFLLPAVDVDWVEMLKTRDEITATPAEVKRVEDVLTNLQEKEKEDDDGNPEPPAAAVA